MVQVMLCMNRGKIEALVVGGKAQVYYVERQALQAGDELGSLDNFRVRPDQVVGEEFFPAAMRLTLQAGVQCNVQEAARATGLDHATLAVNDPNLFKHLETSDEVGDPSFEVEVAPDFVGTDDAIDEEPVIFGRRSPHRNISLPRGYDEE